MCGCNKRVVAAGTPMAAAADTMAAAPGMPRFKIVSKTETDPETGDPLVLSTHPDYRSASIAREDTGGLIRVIK
jgi:hypothetical protein